MGPVRASSSKQQHSNTSSRDHKSRKRDVSDTDLPGMQKIKSALRQTRRLLAKDILPADARVETERRLKSLEADLQAAELRRDERKLASKYHKVKFFERRKVLRKIKKVKKELKASATDLSKKVSTKPEDTLFELRVDLNYILHYPKLEKYISLLPSSDGGETQRPDRDDPMQTVQCDTDVKRTELRELIRQRMEAGELSGEPEHGVEIGHGQGSSGSGRSGSSMRRAVEPVSMGVRKIVKSGPVRPSKEKAGQPARPKSREKNKDFEKADRIEDDDFFDADAKLGSGSEE